MNETKESFLSLQCFSIINIFNFVFHIFMEICFTDSFQINIFNFVFHIFFTVYFHNYFIKIFFHILKYPVRKRKMKKIWRGNFFNSPTIPVIEFSNFQYNFISCQIPFFQKYQPNVHAMPIYHLPKRHCLTHNQRL